jgi:hypothetical protein
MVQQLVARLKDPTKEVRDAARSELYKLRRPAGLGIDDAIFLITAATGEFPKPEHESDDPSAPLIFLARDIARDRDPAALLPTISKHFGALHSRSKWGALQILTLTYTRVAAELYVRLLRDHRHELKHQFIPVYEAAAGADVANVLFPSIIQLAQTRDEQLAIFTMLLGFRRAGHVGPDIVKPYHGTIAAMLKAEEHKARPMQRANGVGWRDDCAYIEHRSILGVLFDLAGYLDSKSLLAAVASCGDLLDPRLRKFRAVTLLRRGVAVPDQELDWIAKSPRDRYWLFGRLHGLGLADRLPAACRDQALLAEGHMVDWLCYPTELGREPDEIILFAKESRSHSTGPRLVSWLKKRQMVDYYFFRFRVTEEHWSKKDGWMVGMAGGYQRKDQPTTSHDGGTFSTFAAWGSKTPAEHVEDYLSDEE